MNTLKLVAEKPVPLDSENPKKGISLFFKLQVDGANIVDGPVVDLKALGQSADRSGVYAVLVCSCGDPGCDVVTAEVEATAQTIQWKRLLRADDSGRPPKPVNIAPLVFEKSAYRAAIENAMKGIQDHQNRIAPISVLGPTGPYLQ